MSRSRGAVDIDRVPGVFGILWTLVYRMHELMRSVIAMAEQADHDDRRRQLMVAYKARDSWRSGDAHALRSLGASEVAVRRAARCGGRGRPVTRRYKPTAAVVGTRIQMALRMVSEDATETERRKAFLVWPWWKHHVEALYRGELAVAREVGAKGPHDVAELAVTDALRLSQGRVHAVCCDVRAIRRDDEGMANFPTLTIADFERWMKSGEHPFDGIGPA